MAEEFDSGDDLFDGIDEQQLLEADDESTSQLRGTKRKRHDSKDVSAEARKRSSGHLALAHRLLADKFGYTAFRHEQEAAVLRVLAGENTLVIFPTGAGKSLCYQVSTHLLVLSKSSAFDSDSSHALDTSNCLPGTRRSRRGRQPASQFRCHYRRFASYRSDEGPG